MCLSFCFDYMKCEKIDVIKTTQLSYFTIFNNRDKTNQVYFQLDISLKTEFFIKRKQNTQFSKYQFLFL